MEDRNGNTLSVTYSQGKIVAVTDGAGRQVTLAYNTNADGSFRNLKTVTSPDGKVKRFTYDTDGNLTKITDFDNAEMYYTYDSAHRLTVVRYPSDYEIRYTYTSSSPARVCKVEEYGNNVLGGRLTMEYGFNSTRFTDRQGQVEIRRFSQRQSF